VSPDVPAAAEVIENESKAVAPLPGTLSVRSQK
jgi:hypothetical protein